MAHAERFPVCKGSGKAWVFPSTAGTSSPAPIETACHGCDGIGWVAVSDQADGAIYPASDGWMPANSHLA